MGAVVAPQTLVNAEEPCFRRRWRQLGVCLVVEGKKIRVGVRRQVFDSPQAHCAVSLTGGV